MANEGVSSCGQDQLGGLIQQLMPLVGFWQGAGEGAFPTIDPFTYSERTEFAVIEGEPAIHYVQRTWDTTGDDRPPLHSESGFIRPTDEGLIEVSNAQNSGRVEVLSGKLSLLNQPSGGISLELNSIALANDERMVRSSRQLTLAGDTLRYEMQMTTTDSPQHTTHLRATLQRVS